MKGARSFHRLQDGDHVAWTNPERVQAVYQFLQSDARLQHGETLLFTLIHLDISAVRGRRRPDFGEGARLRDLLGLGDPDGKRSLGDCDGADPDVLTHDNNAGLFVNDDFRGLVWFDPQLLDIRQ